MSRQGKASENEEIIEFVLFATVQRGRSEPSVSKVWAYVFITTKEPRKVVQSVRKVAGVAKADALFGAPDVIAIVEGRDIASMDAVIDEIALNPLVAATDSKVARWIE
jgi:Lrp/AsnC ligand binding domain